MKRKKAALVCAGLFMAANLAGCNNNHISINSAKVTYPNRGIYPVQCEQVLRIWSGGGETGENKRLNEKRQELSGIQVEYIGKSGERQENIGLMIASNDLPDIFITDFDDLPGGVQKYADDGVIIALDEYLSEFAPNLCSVLENDPEIEKMIVSESGLHYMFPFIRGDDLLTVSYGPVVRKDILERAGLVVPETIDEWHTVLQAFKAAGMSAPLSYDLTDMERLSGAFMGAYGIKPDFYVEDGMVHHGLLEAEAKDALANLHQWYDEGLLDPNIAKGGGLLNEKIITSETGAAITYGGSGIGRYMKQAAKNGDTEFNLVAAPFPVLEKGTVSKFGSKEFRYNAKNNGFITSACTNVELAMRFLDFGYSEEGHMLMNFGTEGESYRMIDGYPTYTELITNNPEGEDMTSILSRYAVVNSGPYVQDVRYIEQYYVLPQQKEALTVWGETEAMAHNLPRLTFGAEESTELGKIMNRVDKYADDMMLKFIMGIESLENYDNFVLQLKQYGLERALDLYNAAYQRYQNR